MTEPTDRWSRLPTVLADTLVAGMGLFQLHFTAAVRLGLSFNAFLVSLVLPIAGTLATVWWLHREPAQTVVAEDADGVVPAWHWLTLALASLGAIGWYMHWTGFHVFWFAALIHVGLSLTLHPQGQLGWDEGARRSDLAWLALLAVGGAFATLIIHRPEGDDGYYLSQAVATVQHPELALLSFDPMHGDVNLPVQQPAHKAQGFETFVSVLYRFLPLHPFDIYYRLLPPLFGACAVLAQWVAARALVGHRKATMATAWTVALLVLWAGHYYCFGNFTFARMFQGKGVMVAVFLPLLVYRGLAFAVKPDAKSWWMLLLAQSAVAACTSTGLVVAPIAAALLVLPALQPNKKGAAMAAAGLATALPVIAMLLFVKLDVSAIGTMKDTGVMKTLLPVLGDNWRAPLALTLVLATPQLATLGRSNSAAYLSRYLLAIFVLLFNGYTTNFIAEHGGNLYSWRTYWAWPIPTLMGVGLALLSVTAIDDERRPWRIGSLTAAVFTMAFFASVGSPTWSTDNRSDALFAKWKLPDNEYRIALAAVLHSERDDLMLAPPAVNSRTAPFPSSPKLVAVRRTYSRHLAHVIGTKETNDHIRLLNFLEKVQSTTSLDWVIKQLDDRCVTVLVTDARSHPDKPDLGPRLRQRWFNEIRQKNGKLFTPRYRLWKRSAKRCTAANNAKIIIPPTPKKPATSKPKPKPKPKKTREQQGKPPISRNKE